VITGAASVVFLTTGNSTIQLTSDPAYRGRVTALWSLALVGSTPIGSPIIGALSQIASPRWALALGAAACAVAVAIGHRPQGGSRRRRAGVIACARPADLWRCHDGASGHRHVSEAHH
jgi:MFS family permease